MAFDVPTVSGTTYTRDFEVFAVSGFTLSRAGRALLATPYHLVRAPRVSGGVGSAGAGSSRPASGQVWPRGSKA